MIKLLLIWTISFLIFQNPLFSYQLTQYSWKSNKDIYFNDAYMDMGFAIADENSAIRGQKWVSNLHEVRFVGSCDLPVIGARNWPCTHWKNVLENFNHRVIYLVLKILTFKTVKEPIVWASYVVITM